LEGPVEIEGGIFSFARLNQYTAWIIVNIILYFSSNKNTISNWFLFVTKMLLFVAIRFFGKQIQNVETTFKFSFFLQIILSSYLIYLFRFQVLLLFLRNWQETNVSVLSVKAINAFKVFERLIKSFFT
jgi:hypothetical protein